MGRIICGVDQALVCLLGFKTRAELTGRKRASLHEKRIARVLR